MALDGLYLNLLVGELNGKLAGARVEKLYQPGKTDFVFRLKNRGESYSLLVSASGSNPRICLTSRPPENPDKPPMLCMLMRKHLLGAVLTGLRQQKTDRIVYIDFDATNELGDRVKRTLALEIMAQYSNVILLDETDRVIDSVKRVDLLKSSVRQILPGLPYALPPQQNKPSLADTPASEIAGAVLAAQGRLSSALLKNTEGISPLTSREIAYRSFGDDIRTEEISDIGRLEEELGELADALKKGIYEPVIALDENDRPFEFSFRRITQYGDSVKNVVRGSLSEVLDDFYYEKERLIRTKTRADDLFRLLGSLIERTSRKINSQRTELAAAADRETKRIYAELLQANLYRFGQNALGCGFVELEDYYNNCEMTRIPVRAELSASANAQRYFKEYRKAQTAERILTEQIEKGEADLDYLNSVLDLLTRADSEKEFAAIREELSETGFAKKHGGAKNPKKAASLPPLEFTSPNGFRVFVGRNNVQNDKLTHRTANKNDIWFHTQKIHGSHVILVTDNREPQAQDMEYAASLAVYHSSARDSKLVPVDYTLVRNIKKPAGAKPGFVIYHIYKTIII